MLSFGNVIFSDSDGVRDGDREQRSVFRGSGQEPRRRSGHLPVVQLKE